MGWSFLCFFKDRGGMGMWQKFGVKDRVLRQNMFMADEVQYNLIHRISESERSTCLKASNETMIFAQSEGHNAWLWISKELAAEEKNKLLQELLEVLKETELPGISGDRMTVDHFAEVYSESNGLQYVPYMIMESYVCSEVRKPVRVEGSLHLATRHHLETVAEFLGYASAVVAELCSILKSEGLDSMLYADLKNPDANKVYQNIGFVESGQVADIKFK
jgi:hypothetical protein